MQGTLKLNV